MAEKSNDLIEGSVVETDQGPALLVKVINFHDMCARYDEHELEYDPDDLWDAYQRRGFPWDVLVNGELTTWWPDHLPEVLLVLKSPNEAG